MAEPPGKRAGTTLLRCRRRLRFSLRRRRRKSTPARRRPSPTSASPTGPSPPARSSRWSDPPPCSATASPASSPATTCWAWPRRAAARRRLLLSRSSSGSPRSGTACSPWSSPPPASWPTSSPCSSGLWALPWRWNAPSSSEGWTCSRRPRRWCRGRTSSSPRRGGYGFSSRRTPISRACSPTPRCPFFIPPLVPALKFYFFSLTRRNLGWAPGSVPSDEVLFFPPLTAKKIKKNWDWAVDLRKYLLLLFSFISFSILETDPSFVYAWIHPWAHAGCRSSIQPPFSEIFQIFMKNISIMLNRWPMKLMTSWVVISLSLFKFFPALAAVYDRKNDVLNFLFHVFSLFNFGED